MRKVVLLFVLPVVLLSSCSKNNDTPASSNVFSVKINGTATEFDVLAATLLRSTTVNQKRFDISGKSKDGKYLLVLTVGEETAVGNGITVAPHEVKLFNDDDPSTPDDESEIMSDAFATLAVYIGTSTYTDVFAENGVISITGCNETSTTISGNFNISLESKGGGEDYNLTEGNFSNIKYTVIN